MLKNCGRFWIELCGAHAIIYHRNIILKKNLNATIYPGKNLAPEFYLPAECFFAAWWRFCFSLLKQQKFCSNFYKSLAPGRAAGGK